MKLKEKIMDVSVIIVNYNTKDLSINCIKSIIEKTKDVEYSKEFLLDNQESKLKERDVNDFIIIVKFFEKHTLNVINNKLTFCDMIENIMIEFSQIKEIEKSFFNYIIRLDIFFYFTLIFTKININILTFCKI